MDDFDHIDDVKELRKQLKTMRRDNKTMAKELMNLKGELDGREDEHDEKMGEAFGLMNEAKEHVESITKKLTKSQKKEAKAQGKIESLEAKLVEAEDELWKAQAEIQQLKESLATVGDADERGDVPSLMAELEHYKIEMEEMHEKMQQAELSATDCERKYKALIVLSEQRDKMQSKQIAELTKKTTDQEEKNEKRKSKNEMLKRDLKMAREELEEQRLTISMLQQGSMGMDTVSMSMDSDASNHAQEDPHTKSRVSMLEAEVASLKEDRDLLEEDCMAKALQLAELSHVSDRNYRLTRRIKEMTDKLAQVETEKELSMQKAAKLSMELADTQAHEDIIADLETALAENHHAMRELQKQLDSQTHSSYSCDPDMSLSTSNMSDEGSVDSYGFISPEQQTIQRLMKKIEILEEEKARSNKKLNGSTSENKPISRFSFLRSSTSSEPHADRNRRLEEVHEIDLL